MSSPPFALRHYLSDINETTHTATCQVCGPVGLESKGRYPSGKQQWRCAVKKRAERYSISPAEYQVLLDTHENLCGICGEQFDAGLYIDHDHSTGKVRGLLCCDCNLGLGRFYDNPDFLRKAAEYLEKHELR